MSGAVATYSPSCPGGSLPDSTSMMSSAQTCTKQTVHQLFFFSLNITVLHTLRRKPLEGSEFWGHEQRGNSVAEYLTVLDVALRWIF